MNVQLGQKVDGWILVAEWEPGAWPRSLLNQAPYTRLGAGREWKLTVQGHDTVSAFQIWGRP